MDSAGPDGRQSPHRSDVVKVQLLHDLARVPTRATSGSAGYDLYTVNHQTVEAGHQMVIKTGIALELPENTAGILFARSSSARQKLEIFPGVLDADYRGEVLILVHNRSSKSIEIRQHQRLAQLLIVPVETPEIQIVQEIASTSRGAQGFGSTGR